MLSSLFSTAFALTQDDRSGIFAQRSSSELAASSAAQEVSRVGARIAQRALSIKPTLEIRPGTQFRVRVKRDWILHRPWPMQR